ncbi:MAG: caspase family protein [Saprospiraceae bacterium]|nr:caspase family protein [Saprospiraceae bacterium]
MRKTIFTLLVVLYIVPDLEAQRPLLVVPMGHSGGVRSFMPSANGKYFLTLGGDDLIKLWNDDGREIRTFKTPGLRFTSLKLSPDNQHILAVSCYTHMDAWILDVQSGEITTTLKGHSGALRAEEYSKDGHWIATGAKDSTAIIWDATTGKINHRLRGHQQSVIALAFSPDGKWLATLSEDKTVKIWETNTGQLLQTLDVGGELPSEVQFSPDGKVLSVATGWSENSISLWSTNTWTKIRDLEGYSFRFSPDGQWVCVFRQATAYVYPSNDLEGSPRQALRATIPPSEGPMPITVTGGYFLPNSKGMLLSTMMGNPEVYDINSGQKKLCLMGYATSVETVCFSPDAKKCLIGSGSDLLEWDFTQGSLAKHFKGLEGKIMNAGYAPDGQTAISVTDLSIGAIWDDERGEKMYTLTPVIGVYPTPQYVRILTFPHEGSYFLRGHSMGGKDGPPFLSIWGSRDGRQIDSLYHPFGDHNWVSDAVFSPDAKKIAVADEHSVLIWDVSSRKWEQLAQNDTLRFNHVAFYGANELAVTTSENQMQYWNIREKKMIGTASIGEYHFKFDPTNYTSEISFVPVDKTQIPSNSLFFSDLVSSPDQRWLASASDKVIGLFLNDRENPPHLNHVLEGHNNQVLQLDFSADGRRLISVSRDKTVRIWDLDTQNEIACIVHLNQHDWAVTTPSGLFDASPGAMELMYFLVGEEVIELEQLKKRYYEPGLLSKLMGFASDELRNVEEFMDLTLYPGIQAEIADNQLKIQLTERNGGIGKLSLFINGTERGPEDINPERKMKLSIDLKTFSKYLRDDTLNTIALRVYNAEGWLKSQAYKLPYIYTGVKGSGQGSDTPGLGNAKPRLFAILVGTADYSGEKLDLKYADQDAASMAAAIASAGKELYDNDVYIRLFTTGSNLTEGASGGIPNELSSKANIKAAFEALAKQDQVQPTDVVVCYFSGHGITYGEAENAQFYYLTKDIASEDLSDPEVRRQYTISTDTLTNWIKNIAALKQVLIFDACNSGKIVESLASIGKKELNPSQVRAFDEMKDRTGMFILTGSAADKVSYEASQYGQGLLTYSLLQGMSGFALADENRVDVMTLFQHCRKQVPELAKSINGIQNPVLSFPVDGGSFYIGRVNQHVKIPLAQLKPVFIRNIFQDEDAFEDVLGLGDALEEYFRQQTAKGAQSKLIYVDVKDYDNAYAMKGRYKIQENEVEVRMRLFKGKTVVGEEFKFNGKKDDVRGLVKQILGAIIPLAK